MRATGGRIGNLGKYAHGGKVKPAGAQRPIKAGGKC